MDEVLDLRPRCGDVIFTATTGVEQLASVWIQRKVDPLAVQSSRVFTHVAVVVNETIALEAVPAPTVGHGVVSNIAAKREAKDNVGKTRWSGVDLDFGVRPIPVEDILVGAFASGTDWAVLRSSQYNDDAARRLDLQSDEMLALLGSEYTIAALHEALEGQLNRAQAALAATLPRWVAPAQDLKTLLRLEPQHLKLLDEWAPDSLPDYQTRSFFCSQLVPFLLTHGGLLAHDATPPNVTPSGLYKALSDVGWLDVTRTHYSPDAARRLLNDDAAAASCSADFSVWQLLIKNGKSRIALGSAAKAVGGGLNAMNKFLDGIEAKLPRHLPPQKQ